MFTWGITLTMASSVKRSWVRGAWLGGMRNAFIEDGERDTSRVKSRAILTRSSLADGGAVALQGVTLGHSQSIPFCGGLAPGGIILGAAGSLRTSRKVAGRAESRGRKRLDMWGG